MRKFKDTGRLLKDIKSSLDGRILGRQTDLILIEKWVDETHIIVTDTETKQSFKIHSRYVKIDYPDVAKS